MAKSFIQNFSIEGLFGYISVIGPDNIMEVNNNLEYINAKYPNVPDVDSVKLDASLQEINDDLLNIRGKYVFEFIEYIACVLNKDVKGQKKYTEGKVSFEKTERPCCQGCLLTLKLRSV